MRDVHVYLPPGRGADDCAGLPLIVVLPGFGSRGRALLGDNLWSPSLDDRVDALIDGGCPPFVMCLPDASTRLGGSQYLNSDALGRYQDHLIGEVVPFVRDRFGTGRTGVVGKSSGGFGALRLAMAAPHLFEAAASHSGDCYFEYCYGPDLPKAAAAILRAGSVEAFLADFTRRERKTTEQILTLSVLAMAAAYAPDRQAPRGYRLPFDETTGALRAAVFEQWLAHDPLRLVARHVGELRSLRALFLDAGTRDEFYLHIGARLLSAELARLGIAHVHEEFDDGHMGTSYRYARSLPLIARALG